MSTATRLRLVSHVTPADWVVRRIGPFGSGVGGLLPHGFDAYARILHPAVARDASSGRDGRPVRWATVAAWSGGTIHPRVEFAAIARPPTGVPASPPPFVDAPPDGNLRAPVLSVLCELLGRHTETPDRCWFFLWDGYGWIHGAPVDARRSRPEGGIVARVVARLGRLGGGQVAPAFAPAFGIDGRNGPRVRLPNRDYLLFEGPLVAAPEMGWEMTDEFFEPQSPNLFWPEDHAWCVATEIDLDSTFVGGSVALIDQLLADRRLEALPADLADPVWASSDEVNG